MEQVEDESKELSHYERWLLKVKARQLSNTTEDEFDRFINSLPHSIDILVLDWWQEASQQRAYPRLAVMAIEVLSAVAMSAESERVFSSTRRIVSWLRARLESYIIQRLECLKYWQASGLLEDTYCITEPGDDEVFTEDDAHTAIETIE